MEKPLSSTKLTPAASRRSSANTVPPNGPPPRATFSWDKRTVSAMRASSFASGSANDATTSSTQGGICKSNGVIELSRRIAQTRRREYRGHPTADRARRAASRLSGGCGRAATELLRKRFDVGRGGRASSAVDDASEGRIVEVEGRESDVLCCKSDVHARAVAARGRRLRR